ncbi:uncharacterized protein FRV6_16594 [Fusarium oxysporum]|uniref:Uncharacterized protein n=1 Tax=Fusarium oxysporum TaxID=5507 RepID=A0A2H3UB11_FUSOX|nr:uncharacterized protein FRV6_16594 [Fusarium oxysporum]
MALIDFMMILFQSVAHVIPSKSRAGNGIFRRTRKITAIADRGFFPTKSSFRLRPV